MHTLQQLGVELGNVKVHIGDSIPFFTGWEIGNGVYVNDEYFVEEVLDDCTSFDAVTYTAHTDMLANCKKLIAAKVLGGNAPRSCKIRIATNVHTKLYIVREGRGKSTVWAGSMNLVRPGSLHNLMIRLEGEQAKSMLLYFQHLWNLA